MHMKERENQCNVWIPGKLVGIRVSRILGCNFTLKIVSKFIGDNKVK